MRMQNVLSCAVAAVLLAATDGVVGSAPLDLRARIEPLARPLIHDHIVVGFVVGILKDGQTQILAFGEITKGSGLPPTGDTIYEIGSVTKVFTGVLLADMVQSGRIKLDDPVRKFLPADVTMPMAAGQPITLEHLATHTSGLPRLPSNLKQTDKANPYADYTVADMYAFLRSYVPPRPPGKYEYSNLGSGLLGHVLALQGGATYEDLLVKRICEPLGMGDTRITLNDDQRKRFAPPYDRALNPTRNWDMPSLAGAGALRSTANDLLKFAKANLATDDKPLTRAMALSHCKRRDADQGATIGLEWNIAQDGITRFHPGGSGGYRAWLGVAPGRNVGVVVLANTMAPQRKMDGFAEQVMRLALDLDFPAQ